MSHAKSESNGSESFNQQTVGFNAAPDATSEKSVASGLLDTATDHEAQKRRWWQNKSLEEKPIDGTYGWVVVAAGCFMLMFSMGCVNSYGSYQTYYHLHQFPSEPVSTLSWVGTLQFAVMNLFGIPAGILCERLDTRLVTFTGGLIMGISLIIASFCDGAVWKLMLTQGIVFAIGASLVFIPATSIPSQWFTSRRALAVGIVVAGSGIGGLWLTPATNGMIDSLGTAWALRITGIIVFVVNSIASLFMRNRLHVQTRDKIVDFSVLGDIKFLLIFAGAVCGTTGYFTPLFSLPAFGLQVVHMKPSLANNLLTIINAASTVGRVVTGQAAPLLGTVNTLALCTFVASFSILVFWLPFEATGTAVACAVIYGLFCGGFISLLPVVIANLWGVQRISTIIGLLYIASFIGTMVGAPSSGAIFDNIGHDINYKNTIAFSGVFMFCAFAFFVCLRFALCRPLFKKV